MPTDEEISPKIDFIRGSNNDHAICDDFSEQWVSYGELKKKISLWKSRLENRSRRLIFLYAHNDITTVTALFGAISSQQPVALFDPGLSQQSRQELESVYSPGWIVDSADSDLPVRGAKADHQLHPDLALLLSTSGSTGSPKLVRLTGENIYSNAKGICQTLSIKSGDVACGHLPLHYSFGLSVLLSHMLAGASVRLTSSGLTNRTFWHDMRKAGITHFPGVPFHFQMLEKLRYERLDLPDLCSMAQAGGNLDIGSRKQAHEYMSSQSGKFYVMYGQTEAAPRMTTLSHEQFLIAPKSVGQALPECKVDIKDPDENGHGEVSFSGPNVMMGYAESSADLLCGDTQHGSILTGDIGHLDKFGNLTLVGRIKRFAKVFGLRVNLDEIESEISQLCSCAVIQDGDKVKIFLVNESDDGSTVMEDSVLAHLKNKFTIPATFYGVVLVDQIPKTQRGKIDYTALAETLC